MEYKPGGPSLARRRFRAYTLGMMKTLLMLGLSLLVVVPAPRPKGRPIVRAWNHPGPRDNPSWALSGPTLSSQFPRFNPSAVYHGTRRR